jgi:hypothetical protein
MKTFNKKAILEYLNEHDETEDENSYMELTLWGNKEGFDVEIYSNTQQFFQMHLWQFKLLKKLYKELMKDEEH